MTLLGGATPVSYSGVVDPTTKNSKARLLETISGIPDDLPVGEFLETIDVLVRSEIGKRQVARGQGVPLSKLKGRLTWRRLGAQPKRKRKRDRQ